jgi:hypothetical protein
MAESVTVVWLGVILLIMAVILLVEHHKREQHRMARHARWLDTHPTRDWLHHRS